MLQTDNLLGYPVRWWDNGEERHGRIRAVYVVKTQGTTEGVELLVQRRGRLYQLKTSDVVIED